MSSRDDIYSVPLTTVGSFQFDSDVVRVFPDMIARSVPGYASILSVIEQLAVQYVQPGSSVWDLGCSLGAATRLIRRRVDSSVRVHAVDNSSAMIQRLQQLLPEWEPGAPVLVTESDLRQVQVRNASLVVLNLTLQFLPPGERDGVIGKIAAGMLPGGALLLSEKICFEDPRQQELMTKLHHDFKRAHGYSDLEIAQKRSAIENMLIPEPLQRHVQRLTDAGFSAVIPWFQCFNFASIIAVR
jgi:tRNA (cmo5U34)-methyltransferase